MDIAETRARQSESRPRETAYDGFMSYSHAADDLLAPRLQAGLQRFAKPWWKRRALRVFRDEASLSANPHLWSSIAEALDRSGWFLLLLSPEAASSPWVNREVEYWLEHKDADRIIPVLTDGEFGWVDGDIVSDAAPPALYGAFADEPRWVDLRFAEEETQLDLKNPDFSAAVADVASAIRRVPKDELASEEVRQHRRTIRTAWAAGIALIALAITATGAAVYAAGQRNEAAQNEQLAVERAAEAEAAREAEAEQRAEAEAQRALAEQNAALARSRELAASAVNVLDNDPGLSKLLALAAAEIADPPIESVSALHQAFQADRVVARYSWPEDVIKPWSLGAALHPSGERLVASGESGIPSPHLEVVDIATGEVIWAWDVAHPGVAIERPRFSEDGELVITGALWESRRAEESPPPAEELGVFVFDADNGDLVRHIDMGRCGATVQAVSGSRILVKTISENQAGCFFPVGLQPDAYHLELIDFETGASELLTVNARIAGFTTDGGAAFSGDGRIVAFDEVALERVVVLDVGSGERIAELDLGDPDQADSFVWRLNQDGSLLVYGRSPIHVVEVATGQVMAEIEPGNDAWVELVGSTVLVTAQDGALYGYEAATGSELFVFPGVGNGTVSANADGLALVSNGTDGAVLIDTLSRGEMGAVETCPAFVWSWSLTATSEIATFLQACEGFGTSSTTQAIDLTTMEVAYALTGGFGQQQPISPDGTRFVRQDHDGLVGPLVVHDLSTGEPLLELPATCRWDPSSGLTEACAAGDAPPFAFFAHRVRWSPDGTMIGATSQTGPLAVWDAESGELLFWESVGAGPFEGDLNFHTGVVFTPDSSGLVTSYWGPAVRRFSTQTWQLELETTLPTAVSGTGGLTFVDYTEDGSSLVAGTELGGGGVGASLHWLDADTLNPQFSKENLHEGGLTVMTMNGERSLLATGSGNGVIRVWDSATGELIHELLLGDSWISGLAFIDDSHLAVTPRLGSLFVVTIDTEELLSMTRDSLTRGFTEFECGKYNFGNACPTLEEMRAGT